MPEDGIRSIANGKVWTGQQALGLKLIDQIGDFQTVVRETANAVGIRGKPSLVRLSQTASEPARPVIRRCFRISAGRG